MVTSSNRLETFFSKQNISISFLILNSTLFPSHLSKTASHLSQTATSQQLPGRFKGSPYVFKRRQPILDPQQAPPSDSSQGKEFTQFAILENEPKPSVSDCTNSSNPNYDDLDLPIVVRKGVWSCTQHPLTNFLSYHRLSQNHKGFLASLDSIVIPKTVEEALRDQNWKQAMMEEMKALKKNQTWEIVSLPKNVLPVGCKWVFNVKYKMDGTLERYKARLVAKGYT